MDAMVLKYMALAGVTYGIHSALAIGQLALGAFLIANGVLALRGTEAAGLWQVRFGLVGAPAVSDRPWLAWVFITAGAAAVVPVLGLSYWIVVAMTPVAIGCIAVLSRAAREDVDGARLGRVVRRTLAGGALVLAAFTAWEGRELVRAAWDVNYDAIYWRNLEVAGWQAENDPNAPKPGEMAPDFELSDPEQQRTVRLSDFRGERPVVLLFGSFT